MFLLLFGWLLVSPARGYSGSLQQPSVRRATLRPVMAPAVRRRSKMRMAASPSPSPPETKDYTRGQQSSFAMRATILTGLVVQSAGVSLLAQRMCRTVTYSGAAVSFLQELVKLPVAIIFLCVTGSGRRIGKVLKRSYLRPVELLQLCVPAGCFAAQNVLFFVAHERISSTTYLVLSQMKALFTAVFSVALLPGKRLRKSQWIAQPILAAGAILVLLPQVQSGGGGVFSAQSATLSRFLVGVNAALASAVISGFANVYFERLIKSEDDAFWPRQLQLATATALFTLFALPTDVPFTSLVAQFTPGVWAIVFIKSLGGLLIGATIRYTSSIAKNFCTAVAIALTAALNPAALTSIPFLAGLFFVFASMALFNWPPKDTPAVTNTATIGTPPPPSR